MTLIALNNNSAEMSMNSRFIKGLTYSLIHFFELTAGFRVFVLLICVDIIHRVKKNRGGPL